MPDIDKLLEKVEAFLPAARHLIISDGQKLSRRSLIRYLGPHMDDREFSLMMRGRSEKGIPPGRISEADFERLAELLAKVIGGKCTTSDARQLWQGDPAAFKAALGVGENPGLIDTLSRAPAELEIAVQKKKKSTLRSILSAQVVPDNAFTVTSRECLQFKIAASPGQRLIVLCQEPGDVWRLIAPGHLHDGIITEKTILPNVTPPWLAVDPPFGLHTFVFIGHDAKLAGLLPVTLPDNRILNAGDIAKLARRLASPAIAGRWRGTMKTVNAVEAA